MIEISNLSLIRDNVTILNQIQVTIQDGETWILLGRNGAGKTSLINLIYGYDWATSGTIKVFGMEYGSHPLLPIQKQIGILQSNQQANLLQKNLTVHEILITGIHSTLGLYKNISDNDSKLADQFLEDNSLLPLRNRMFGQLSSGEKSKTLLLRSIILSPKILILDEPTSSLDLRACFDFFLLLQSIIKKENLTCILVVHRLDDIPKFFSHIALLKEGRIIHSGDLKSQFTLENLSNLYDLQISELKAYLQSHSIHSWLQ